MSKIKTIHFVSGLPRAGSTLFMNVLNQNPEFYSTPSSPLIDIVRKLRDTWEKHAFCKAMVEPERTEIKFNTIYWAMQGFFANTDRPICFDKNRGWPVMLELLTNMYGKENVKILSCVRDLRDVSASFEQVYRETSKTKETSQAMSAPVKNRTAAGRASYMLNSSEPVGYAVDVMTDAITRGWRDNIHYVEYGKLTHNPKKAMQEVYDFLGYPYYEGHDFDNVQQTTKENDDVHGFTGLHDIFSKIEPQDNLWKEVYDKSVFTNPIWKKIENGCDFWRHL